MRDIVFHLADSHMEGALRAFFRRDNWHFALQCRRFDIDAESQVDIFRSGGMTDGGLWRHAHENLESHKSSHKRAVIILDQHFEGSPGASALRVQIAQNLIKAGWKEECFEIVVIEPMLEAWLWADNLNVAKAFGFDSFEELQKLLMQKELWLDGEPKPQPEHLKTAKQVALKLGRSKMGASVFRKLFEQLSRGAINACQEPGFQRMRARLQSWFPVEGGEQ